MRRIHAGSIVIPITLLLFSVTKGASAQVVQLPSFRVFSLSTTVSVPDRGSAYLGGISSSSTGRRERGLPGLSHVPFAGRPFGNRTIAGHTRTSGVSVGAYIHDFEAMDEDLLRQASPVARRSLPATNSPDVAGRTSIVELRRQDAARQRAELGEARQDFERARVLLTQGRTGMAKYYFQRAAKGGDAELRAKISHALRTPRSTEPLAQTSNRAGPPR
ncbi:MAG: hypothetical protein WD894_23855 [Pirellulales bacterium]